MLLCEQKWSSFSSLRSSREFKSLPCGLFVRDITNHGNDNSILYLVAKACTWQYFTWNVRLDKLTQFSQDIYLMVSWSLTIYISRDIQSNVRSREFLQPPKRDTAEILWLSTIVTTDTSWVVLIVELFNWNCSNTALLYHQPNVDKISNCQEINANIPTTGRAHCLTVQHEGKKFPTQYRKSVHEHMYTVDTCTAKSLWH